MLPEQKDVIIKNFVPLVQECNVESLARKLVQKNVFAEQEIKEIFASQDSRHNKRLFFFSLQKKPQTAFSCLIQALKDTAQSSLADLLAPKPFNLGGCKPFHPPLEDDEEETELSSSVEVDVTSPTVNVNFDITPTIVKVKLSSEFCDTKIRNGEVDTYRCRSRRRGRVLIINNYDFTGTRHEFRTGAEVDANNLKELFRQMGGWEVEHYSNQNTEQILSILKDFVQYKQDKRCDICFVIIMSHGNEHLNKTIIYGVDGKYVSASDVEDHFTNERCKLFRGIPKVLLFQVCRGTDLDIATPRTETDGFKKGNHTPLTESDGLKMDSLVISRAVEDMLIGYATLQGYKAHRDTHLGTWYVDLICQIFMEHAWHYSVEELLSMVDKRLRKRVSEKHSLQTSEYNNRGFKRLYLNPGIYEQGGDIHKYYEL